MPNYYGNIAPCGVIIRALVRQFWRESITFPTMWITQALGLVIHHEIARQCLSVAWLALASGIPERTLRNILSGQDSVKLTHVRRIAHALQIPTGELVTRADVMSEPLDELERFRQPTERLAD